MPESGSYNMGWVNLHVNVNAGSVYTYMYMYIFFLSLQGCVNCQCLFVCFFLPSFPSSFLLMSCTMLVRVSYTCVYECTRVLHTTQCHTVYECMRVLLILQACGYCGVLC